MPTSDYTPTLDEVGALLRARTVDAGGNEVGTFTATTSPTNTEVTSLITEAVNDAFTIFGEDIPDAPGNTASPTYDPDALRKSAKSAVAYHAAALVELNHAPEQVTRGNSPYQQYEDLWEKGAKRVSAAIESAGGQTPGGDDTGTRVPDYDFPEDQGGMVGWGTVW